VSPGEIRITWGFPATTPNQELTTTHFKITYINYMTLIIHYKLVSIDHRETVISNLNIQQPYYARVSTVRNYNGEELIQSLLSTLSSVLVNYFNTAGAWCMNIINYSYKMLGNWL